MEDTYNYTFTERQIVIIIEALNTIFHETVEMAKKDEFDEYFKELNSLYAMLPGEIFKQIEERDKSLRTLFSPKKINDNT